VLPDGVVQRWLPPVQPSPVRYEPVLLGEARIHFTDAKAGWTSTQKLLLALPIDPDSGGAERVDWSQASELPNSTVASPSPAAGELPYGALPPEAARPRSYAAWRTALKEYLFRAREMELFAAGGLRSRPGEAERDFRARLADGARERRDAEVEKLRARLEPKAAALRDRLGRAEAKVQEQRSQATARRIDTVASAAGAVFGALFGRRKLSSTTIGRAASTVRSYSRQTKESRDVELAEESVDAIRARIAELEQEITAATADIEARSDPAAARLETVRVKPIKADVEVVEVALGWLPDRE
jgi:hypothetical protein